MIFQVAGRPERIFSLQQLRAVDRRTISARTFDADRNI
ncbi:hypothetical protein RLEG3_12845 [Rhizobium leguminosarum bv. trifolii WSM1689]|nr:hypothetical protein RLEG3_12845 [Rhizobium leguminosarum bv. trifolii WSM1689]